MDDIPYSRGEVLAAGEGAPERGLLCQHCKTRIPQFADLSEADTQKLLLLISQNCQGKAMLELRSATGCSAYWAKIWVLHGGQPRPPGEDTPCPHCGKPLRTPLAKQCRFCHRDWHSEPA